MDKPSSIHDYANAHFKEQTDALKNASVAEEKATWVFGAKQSVEDRNLDMLLLGTGAVAGLLAEKKLAYQSLVDGLMGTGLFDEEEARYYARSIEIHAKARTRKELKKQQER